MYHDVQSFREDVERIFANAKYFNQETSLVWQDADALEVSSPATVLALLSRAPARSQLGAVCRTELTRWQHAFAEVMHYVPPEVGGPAAPASAPATGGAPKLKLKLNIGGGASAGVDSPTPKLTFKMGSAVTPAAPVVPEPVDEKTTALLAAQAEKEAAIAALPVIDYATADPAEVIRHLHVRGVHPQPSSRPPPPPPLSAARQAMIVPTGQASGAFGSLGAELTSQRSRTSSSTAPAKWRSRSA